MHFPRISRLGAVAASAFVALAPAGCFPAPVPMRAVRYDAPAAAPARCLLVLLPGVFDSAEDFEKEGMLATIRASGLSVDVVASHATLGYYRRGMMPEQLFVDVVRPAKARRAYEQTWLVGVSMGGLGALLGAQHHASELAGVVALAPYLGRDETIAAIDKAGGLDAWTAPPAAPTNEDNYDTQLWRWLKSATHGEVPSPEITIGWGRRDERMRRADALLGAQLPRERVFLDEGAHEWSSWNRLLARILREGTLARSCKPPSPAP